MTLRDFPLNQTLGPHDVRIKIHTVGICGSDVHYYTHGRIGPFVVTAPMVLGHEAAGTVVECGAAVGHLTPGQRVWMEPGIPDPTSKAARRGLYNVDPSVRFWATPPVHGCLTPEVIHPAGYTFPIPDHLSFAEGAMVEPLAVEVHAAQQAAIRPGDLAVVMGAGPIGMMVAPVPVDIVGLQAKEATVRTIFRYANVYDRAIALMASGKIDLKPLISGTFPFARSIEAFDRAVEARPTDVKLQIELPQ